MKSLRLGGLGAWMSVMTGAMFYCYQFILRVSPNVMDDDIMTAFAIDAVLFGWIVSAYYWSYSALQVPLGVMMDRLGPKKIIATACCLCGVACFIFAYTNHFYLACIARFMMGMGASCGFLGSLKLGSLWVKPDHFGSAIAITYVFGALGATLGGAPLSMLNDLVGWQNSINILGFTGFVLAAAVLLIVRDNPKNQPIDPNKAKQTRKSMLHEMKIITKNGQAWLIAIYGMLMYVPMVIIGDAWGKGFMSSSYGIDEKSAVFIASMIFYGAAVGSPCFTTISDYTQRRIQPMLFGSIVCFLAYLVIIYVTDLPLTVLYALFFIVGFGYSSKGLSFASVCEIIPRECSGSAIGFTNMVVMFTGIIFHPLVGYLLNWNWNGAHVKGAPFYAASDYRFALSVIPICLAISIIMLKFIKETHPGRKG